jgi:hypothetical protein
LYDFANVDTDGFGDSAESADCEEQGAVDEYLCHCEVWADVLTVCDCTNAIFTPKDPHIYHFRTFSKMANPRFFVMPPLRHFDDPPFSTVAEAVDFNQQMLQITQTSAVRRRMIESIFMEVKVHTSKRNDLILLLPLDEIEHCRLLDI